MDSCTRSTFAIQTAMSSNLPRPWRHRVAGLIKLRRTNALSSGTSIEIAAEEAVVKQLLASGLLMTRRMAKTKLTYNKVG